MTNSKILILMRHAQTEMFSPAGLDEARELTDKGFQQAIDRAKLFKQNHWQPELVLTSHAARAKATAETIAREGIFNRDRLESHESIYNAPADEILGLLHKITTDINCALLVGHNPTIHDLASRLCAPIKGNNGNKIRESLSFGFQPATIAVFSYQNLEDWGLLATQAPDDVKFYGDS